MMNLELHRILEYLEIVDSDHGGSHSCYCWMLKLLYWLSIDALIY